MAMSVGKRSVESVSLSAPRLLIAAAQPYQTLAGPALTVNFLRQPQLLAFQQLPFIHSSVPPFYFHALLHALAEFAETPRPVRQSLVKQIHAPLDDFWRSVGTLNQFSCTVYERNCAPRSREGDGSPLPAKGAAFTHPAMGAVELSRGSHRHECDVRLTLFREDYLPMAAMVMTGPDETTTTFAMGHHGQDGSSRRANKDLPKFLSLREQDRRRTPLSHMPLPDTAASFFHQLQRRSRALPKEDDGAVEGEGAQWEPDLTAVLEAEQSLFFPESSLRTPSPAVPQPGTFGGLYGPLVVMPNNTGFAHRAGFALGLGPTTFSHEEPMVPAATPSSQEQAFAKESTATRPTSGAGRNTRDAPQAQAALAEEEDEPAAVPPWALHSLVADFCARLDDAGHLPRQQRHCAHPTAPTLPRAPTTGGEGRSWWVCAYNCQQSGDAIYNVPVDIVIAPPRVVVGGAGMTRVPAWRERVGEPSSAPRWTNSVRNGAPPYHTAPDSSPTSATAVGSGGPVEADKSDREVAVVALRLEMRQAGRVFLDGTFYCQCTGP